MNKNGKIAQNDCRRNLIVCPVHNETVTGEMATRCRQRAMSLYALGV